MFPQTNMKYLVLFLAIVLPLTAQTTSTSALKDGSNVSGAAWKTNLGFLQDGSDIAAALGYTPADDVDVSGKQDTLVSGTNIKTVNGTSLLGSGDLTISGGTGSGADVIDVTAAPYSAVGDGARADGVSMTSGSATLTSTNSTFYNSGAYGTCVGKRIRVEGGTAAGVQQVETATAAGSITVSGNLTVTVTGASLVGSPRAVSVAVVSGDDAATWAAKVRAAFGSDGNITQVYTVGGSSADVTLTTKAKAANDATLNIAFAAGTAANASLPISTSANTTSGVAMVDLITTIAGYTNSNTVTLSAVATANVSSKSAFHGTDNTTVIQNAINAALTSTRTRTLYFPPGIYSCNLELKSNVQLVGPANTASEEGLSKAGGTVGWSVQKSTATLIPAVTTAPVILAKDATYTSFGCEIRNLQIVGSAEKVGEGIRGGSGWGGTGYSFANATIYGVNVSGFDTGIVVSNATEIKLDNFCSNECNIAVTVWNVDDCLISRCYSINSGTLFKVGGSKHTIIFSGCANDISKWLDIYNSSVTVLDYNVENATTSVIDLQEVSGQASSLQINHIKVLNSDVNVPFIRNYTTDSLRNSQSIIVMSGTATGKYWTINSQPPDRLPVGTPIIRYSDTTWSTVVLTRNANDYQDSYRRSTAWSYGNEVRPRIRYYDKFHKTYAAGYGNMGWTTDVIAGGAWTVSNSAGTMVFERGSGTPTSLRFQATPWITQPNAIVLSARLRGISQTTDGVVRFGLYVKDGTAALQPSAGFGMKLDCAADSVLKLEKIVSGTPTEVATTITKATIADSTFDTVVIRYDTVNSTVSLALFSPNNLLLGPEVTTTYSFPGATYYAPGLFLSTPSGTYTFAQITDCWIEE